MAGSSRQVNDNDYEQYVNNILFDSDIDEDLDSELEIITERDSVTGADSDSSDDELAPQDEDRIGNNIIVNWDWVEQDNNVRNIPFTGQSGINNIISRRLGADCTELDIFFTFLSDDFWELIARETNIYAATKQPGNIWKDVCVDELKLYISLCILMSQHKKSKLNDYWTKRKVIQSPIFGETMPRDRFKLISRFLHFSSINSAEDKMRKIRTIIDYLLHKFQFVFTPGQNICIDESLMAFRGRLSFIQFNPSKRARFGIKIYKVCDSDTGYCNNFKIYVGKEGGDANAGMLMSEQVVLQMTEKLLDEGRVLYMDNWYSSPVLFKTLLDRDTYAVGTVRKNRKFFPKELASVKLNKGEQKYKSSNNILALKWQDRKPVCMLSSSHSTPDYVDVITQRGKQVSKPIVVNDYNKNMCGVNKEDEKLNSFPVMRRYSKGYKKLFFYLLDMTLYNSSVIHHIKTGKKQSISDFRVNIAEQILENIQIPNHYNAVGRPSSVESPMRLQAKNWAHFPDKIPSTTKERNARRCKVCAENNKRSETVWWCKKCQIPLHIPKCFEDYHTKVKY